LRGEGKCIVVKNTLAERAFSGGELEPISGFLSGPSLLVLGEGDVSKPIKTFLEFQKKVKKLPIRGGVIAGDKSPLDGKSIEEIGNLPSKEVLLGQIAGALTSTPSQMVQTINQIIGGIGELAVQIAEKNQK